MRKSKDKTEIGSLFGERVSVTKVNNRVVLTNRPKRSGKKRKLTANEIAQREHFQQAARYASFVQNDEHLNALYAARKRGKYESAYTVALADFHHPPTVKSIVVGKREAAGNKDEIAVSASDDFMVTRVSVEIFAEDGTFLEKGDATQDQTRQIDVWYYIPSIAQPALRGMKIIAAAYDRPGNKTVREIVSV